MNCSCPIVPESETNKLDKMKVAELKAICKEHGLKVSGKKAQLVERIRDHLPDQFSDASESKEKATDDLATMNDADLRDFCVARGLPGKGDRAELLDRLRKDVSQVSELKDLVTNDREGCLDLCDALEAASKQGGALAECLAQIEQKKTAPKYIDLRITSVGVLEPFKFTAGGAPSVTADVLRTLAGDPTADPPKYGKVSIWRIFSFFKVSSFSHNFTGL